MIASSEDSSAGVGKVNHALSVLKDIDNYKNLHRSAAVFVFVASAAIGVLSLFLTLDLTKWLDLDIAEPWMQISIPYFLSFLVWILSFFLIMTALDRFGVKDLGSVARERLSSLNLSPEELDELHHDVEANGFKHKSIFENVITDVRECSLRT